MTKRRILDTIALFCGIQIGFAKSVSVEDGIAPASPKCNKHPAPKTETDKMQNPILADLWR